MHMRSDSVKVSVIVPVYNVEKFIERCTESLLAQTMKEAEFIFVDDASPDGSMAVVRKCEERHPERAGQVRILRHDVNKGLPAARNTGLEAAVGQYIFHCDSDDYADPGMLEALYGEAISKDADAVWCDWYLSFGRNERYMRQPSYDTPEDALKGMLAGAMKFNVWNKLAKRTLYTDNGIVFPAGYGMGEDMTVMMLFASAKKVAYLPEAFYHYVKVNTDSFTRTFSEKHQEELKYNVKRMEEYLSGKFGHDMDTYIAYLKLAVKYPFLMSASPSRYRLWKEWYPEADRYAWQNRQLSLRSRILQWCAWKRQFWVVWLHYVLLQKIVYGIIYR